MNKVFNFSESKGKHFACVYCLCFPNGKRYVGKTKDLGKRMCLYERFGGSSVELSSALTEFGLSSILVEVLEQVSCVDVVNLELCLGILEIRYIRDFGTLYPLGLNVSLGGECLGIPSEYITTDASSIRGYVSGDKAILCYDLEGRFVKDYPSIARCAYDNGVEDDIIRKSVGKMKPFADKWYLRFKRYDYIPEKIEVPYYEVKERVKYKDVVVRRVIEKDVEVHTYIPALKYDMNGKFCGEYKSKRDACRTFLKNSTCSWGEYRNGYILFKKVSEDYPKEIEDYTILCKKQLKDYYVPSEDLEDLVVNKTKRIISNDYAGGVFTPKCIDGKYTNIKNSFPIAQYDLSGKLLSVFDNMRDAADITKIPYSGIWACVMGKTRKAHGYKWAEYKEESIEEV